MYHKQYNIEKCVCSKGILYLHRVCCPQRVGWWVKTINGHTNLYVVFGENVLEKKPRPPNEALYLDPRNLSGRLDSLIILGNSQILRVVHLMTRWVNTNILKKLNVIEDMFFTIFEVIINYIFAIFVGVNILTRIRLNVWMYA